MTSSYKRINRFIVSPLVMLSTPWLIVSMLYLIDATTNLVPIPSAVTVLFTSVFIVLLISQFLTMQKKSTSVVLISTESLKFQLKWILVVWIIGSVLEILFSGGLPIFWALQGSEKDYTNFGLPSVHGLMNGLYFALTGGLAFIYYADKSKRVLLLLALMLCWPVLMLGRGILLTALIQVMVLYLFFNGLSRKVVFKVILFALATIVLFGIIGDMRGVENPFRYLVTESYVSIFEKLPAGFLWVYIYITSPLSNYAFNAGILEPSMSFEHSTVNLYPTLLRPEGLVRADSFDFVDPSLNVSTIFASSHSDFGYLGDVAIIFLLLAWSFYWFYKLKKSVYYILPYAMVCCVLIFSVFYNLFLLYPYLFSTVLQGFIAKQSVQLVKSQKTT